MKISLVIPAYNEEERLGSFLDSIVRYLNQNRRDIREIILVDDGSTDKTVKIAQQFKQKLEGFRIIQHKKNKGKGGAVQTGMLAARGDAIVFMDADGATPIGEIPKMRVALQDADVAIGNRWMKDSQTSRSSALRKLSGWLYRQYMALFGLRGIDTMCGFKGYKREIAHDLFQNLQETGWLFDTEIAYKAQLRDYTIVNFPIRWTSQEGSKLSTSTLIASGLQIWPLIRKIKQEEKGRVPQKA